MTEKDYQKCNQNTILYIQIEKKYKTIFQFDLNTERMTK